ncbi:hypothetical protein GOV13_03650 [Candidatus Pacearchaeota archaeon]|nr:hypothetical protein [Candidatus Pacearchaeota archaeon]
MKPFEYYLKNKLVMKASPNLARARSLIKDINLRLKFLRKIDIKEFPKIYFEHLYDIVRDFCDAILFAEGYKPSSHQASIAYLSKKGFNFTLIKKLDSFRYKRNISKYHGEPISLEEAKDLDRFYKSIKDRLNNLLKDIK